MIKVLLADDHSIVRAGLRRIVEENGEMEVVAEASDGKEALQLVRKAAPDVAVIDISMPGLDGLEVLSQLQAFVLFSSETLLLACGLYFHTGQLC